MIISEEEKKQILKKYKDNTSEEVLIALRRRFPVEPSEWTVNNITPNMISVNGKSYWIENNKKYLVGKLSSILEDEFPNVEKATLRRTVKFYLDLMK